MKNKMPRRDFVKASGGIAAAAIYTPLSCAHNESKKNNILLICSDMAAARHFGCYRDPVNITPNVDRLAESGIKFEQAYCACPPCIPTRVSFMSGQYGHTHGKMAHIKMELNPRPPIIPEILSKHGYRTGLVGKTHWWPSADNLGCDEAYITIDNHISSELGDNDAYLQFLKEKKIFTYNEATWEKDKHLIEPDNLPFECLKVNWTGDKTCSLIEKFSKDEKPFFLYCSFVEPHGSGSVQTEYLKEFQNIPLRPIIGCNGEDKNKPETQRKAVAHWESRYAREIRDDYRRGVYASLSLVDNNIGKILNKLDYLGQRKNTIVIFITDHGDLMFDHGCIEKTFLYETAVHIPFIVSGPGIQKGEIRKHLVSQIDLLPTILDFCRIEESGLYIEGRSAVPIIEDAKSPWRNTLFCEAEQTVHLRDMVASSSAKMLRTGPWKYIYTLVDGHKLEEELYNLDNDPDELLNLAQEPDQQKRIIEFRTEILRWLIATEANRLRPVPQNHYKVPHVDKRYC